MGVDLKRNHVGFDPKEAMEKIGLGKSRLESFLSGYLTVVSFGESVVYKRTEPDVGVQKVWETVGGFLYDALRSGVEKERFIRYLRGRRPGS